MFWNQLVCFGKYPKTLTARMFRKLCHLTPPRAQCLNYQNVAFVAAAWRDTLILNIADFFLRSEFRGRYARMNVGVIFNEMSRATRLAKAIQFHFKYERIASSKPAISRLQGRPAEVAWQRQIKMAARPFAEPPRRNFLQVKSLGTGYHCFSTDSVRCTFPSNFITKKYSPRTSPSVGMVTLRSSPGITICVMRRPSVLNSSQVTCVAVYRSSISTFSSSLNGFGQTRAKW